MRIKPKELIKNQDGAALVITMLVVVALTVTGILASRTSNTEIQIAGHDKCHKTTFFAADAVADGLAPELIEQNIEERGFDGAAPPFTYGNSPDVEIHTPDFYLNQPDTCENNIPSDSNRDVEVSNVGDADLYVRIYGNTELSTGNAIQLPEGYHGRGKGLAGGGAAIVYNVRDLGGGCGGSRARISILWRHLI